MRGKRFAEKQIIGPLKESEAGAATNHAIHRIGTKRLVPPGDIQNIASSRSRVCGFRAFHRAGSMQVSTLRRRYSSSRRP